VNEPNLENDLLQCDWIIAKAKANKSYAQNIYAALCNMEWQKLEIWPILKEETWGCSWRYAGGLVARLIEQGDYLDWYCSGIGNGLGNGDEDGSKKYAPEGIVSDEIEEDFLKLGWVPVPYEDEGI
jgi:hypothetical protein